MQLAQLLAERPDELAADLMETYGVCIDHAMEGGYSAPFVAALADQLPQSCRWRVSYDMDAWWDGDRLLDAALVNALNGLIWGLSDRKKRGPAPKPIGPKWAAKKGASRKLAAIAMTKAELMDELAKPREAVM